MQIFKLKIAKCKNSILWYSNKVGEEIYATSINDSLFREIITGRYCSLYTRKPIDISGNYIQRENVEVMEVFEGKIVAEVSIERS